MPRFCSRLAMLDVHHFLVALYSIKFPTSGHTMLTGVEIAGTILAVLPLVISALESYKRGVRPIKTLLWIWRLELEDLVRCLKTQKYFFRMNLRRILEAAAPGDDNYRVPDDPAVVLQNDRVRAKVERYLEDSETLEVFDDVIGAYRSSMHAIISKLKHIHRPRQVGYSHLYMASITEGDRIQMTWAKSLQRTRPRIKDTISRRG
jgi:hypothetical protein